MRIKILVSCSGTNFSYIPGQTPDVEAAVAKDLIAAGYAEEIKAAKAKGGDGGDKP